MLDLHITHTGEYHLQRLEALINGRFQKNFDYDDDRSLKEMIAFASHTQDQDIQREFLLFYLNCGSAIKEILSDSPEIKDKLPTNKPTE